MVHPECRYPCTRQIRRGEEFKIEPSTIEATCKMTKFPGIAV